MEKPKIYYLLFSVIIFCPVFFILNSSQADAATLSLSPSSGSYSIGSIFTVSILLNTQGQAVDGVDITYLNYNPTYLEVQDENTSLAGVQISPGTLFSNTVSNSVDTTNGRISFSQVATAGSTYSNSANATLATVRFRALTPSTAAVTFNFTLGSTADTNVAAGGSDLLTSVTNGSYTLQDTTPPTISAVSAGSITYNSAVISWTTNELSDSQVEYGLTTSYGSQTTLNTSMVTSHSQSLSGLAGSTLYHYRVRSRDAASNLAVSGDYTFTTSCRTLSLVSSSVLPTSVGQNGSYAVSCDYGATTNAINPVVGSGSCVFANFSGTAANFNCTASSTPGTFSNSCTITNFAPDYYCARTDAIASLTVRDTTSPTTPTNLSATAVSISQINLSWTASTDNVGVMGYRIYRCTGTGCTPSIQIATSTTNSYSDTGLSPSTTYVYRVAAYDAAGNVSGQSSSASATTASAYITNVNFTPSVEGATASGRNLTVTVYQGATQMAQFTAQPNASNQIPLPANTLVSGTYDITTDAQYYLRARQSSISLSSNTTVTLSTLRGGDLNNDGTINSLDWSLMNSSWGSSSYPSDINQDGMVNSIDFSWMNKNWLLSDQ